jgi:ribosome-binding factor A
MDRVDALMLQEISRILSLELRDPRLATVVSVTKVETSPDLQHAKVFISVLGDKDEKRKTLRALKSASGFIHHHLRENLSLRVIPRLEFHLDLSIERGAEMLELIRQVNSSQPPDKR